MYTRSIHEGNIPVISSPCARSFRLPYSLQSNVWRLLQHSIVNETPFTHVECLESVKCSECDTLIKECISLLSDQKIYYLCRGCCVQIWSHVQDSIF